MTTNSQEIVKMATKSQEEIVEISIPYDSKRVTGFVGLAKQGKHYHNALMQILFHLPCFTRAVHQIPESPISSALQRLFTSLRDNDTTVSFGCKLVGSGLEHEIPYLCQELEEIIKGTSLERTIRTYFEGHFVDSHNRNTSFSGLKLEVMNCNDVYSSFDKLLEEKKSFTEFPSILSLHLSRLPYDHNLNMTVKDNDRYEYPLQLDFDRDDGKYLSTHAERSTRNIYTLHSVICQDLDGSYFAFVRPKLSDLWLKIKDELVKKVDAEQYRRHANPIMLVYVKDAVLCTSKEEDTQQSPSTKEDVEANLFVTVKVTIIREGEDDKFVSFRVQKHTSFMKFEDEVADYFGVPRYRLRSYKSRPPSRLIWSNFSVNMNPSVARVLGEHDESSLVIVLSARAACCSVCPSRVTPTGDGGCTLPDIEDLF